jgi:hypothetical protein
MGAFLERRQTVGKKKSKQGRLWGASFPWFVIEKIIFLQAEAFAPAPNPGPDWWP